MSKTRQATNKNDAQKVVTTQQFDLKKLNFEDLDPENEFCPTQMIGWVRYDGETLNYRTPEFEISQYGVSSDGAGTPWPKEEKDRMTIKFPVDPVQPACDEIKGVFTKIDKKMSSKKDLFDPEILREMEEATGFPYTLRPLVRDPKKETPMQRKEAEKKWAAAKKDFSKRKEKCQFWKAKIDSDFKTKKIKTIVWLKDPNWVAKFEGDKEVPQKIIPNNIDHLYELVPYGSKVSVVVAFSKWYADKAEKDGKLVYGVGLKIKQMLVTPRKMADSSARDLPEFAFGDEEVVEEETGEGETNEGTNEETKEEEQEEEENNEEELEEEEEPEPEPEPPKPVNTKKAPTKVEPVKTPAKTPVRGGKK